MELVFKTLKQQASAEIVIKKSRFIGHAKPAESEEEALAFIASIKKEHWNATHNCSAYCVGQRNEFQKQSDDGEPSGTAGKPILEVLRHQDLRNTVVVVTRYFGGIKLGAGGLIRAYTEGATAALAAAIPVFRVLHQRVSVEIDYTLQGKVDHALRNKDVLIEDTQFTDKVTYHCLPFVQNVETFTVWMTELTQGKAKLQIGECLYLDHETFDGISAMK